MAEEAVPGGAPGAAPVPLNDEVEQLREMFKKESPSRPKRKAKAKTQREMPPWNDSPLRPAPWALRGLKTMREPWAEDAAIYNARFGDLHDAQFGPTGAQVRNAGNGMTRHLMEVPKPDGTMWDPTPFRNAPWPLRGLKPVTREPWYHDAAIYNAKFIDDPLEAAGSSGIMDDGKFIDGTFGNTDKVKYDKDGTALTKREQQLHSNWDSSTWRYTPHSLKGIRPVTKEPWARDEATYNNSRNSVNRGGEADFDEDHVDMDGDGNIVETKTKLLLRADGVPEWNASTVAHPGRPWEG